MTLWWAATESCLFAVCVPNIGAHEVSNFICFTLNYALLLLSIFFPILMLFHLFRVHFDSDGQRIQQIYGAAHFTPSVFFFMFANKIKTVYRYNTHKTKTVSVANNKWKCGVWLSVCMRAFGRSFLLAAVNIIIVRSWPGQRFILLLRWVVCCFWLVVCWPYTARLHALFHISNINSLNFNLAIIEMNCILVWYEQLGEKQKSNWMEREERIHVIFS